MKQNNTRVLLLCSVLVVAAVVSRIINAEMQWYNFTPIIAMSLFSGALLKNRSTAYLLPLVAYLLSDIYFQVTAGTGFYGISQFFVYGAMALVVLLGTTMRKPRVLQVFGYSIGGTLLFWLLSNFGVFLGGYWGTGISGLANTYYMALPFLTPQGTELFFNSLVGTLVFSGILFGAFALLKSRVANEEAVA